VANRNPARRGSARILVGITAVILLALMLVAVNFTPASGVRSFAAPLCGDGSAPDYGFTYALQQAHWTVNWQDYASQQAVDQVDTLLDRLNQDSIAQTMLLILPQAQVGNRVNCAVHFLRYMRLGLPDGQRKDNGFVFLIVVEPTRIDVHYGVGLGLPALTASDLTTLNRAAEDAYQPARSMDQALVALVQGFDTVARSKYPPLVSAAPAAGTSDRPVLPSGPLGFLAICGLLVLGVPFLIWFLIQLSRNGIRFNSSGSGSRGGMGMPFGGGRSSGPPTMRGGSGSGRSGRGN
jgi:hypothetical protein